MLLLGDVGIILLDLALDKHRARNVKVSFAMAGVSSFAIVYIMSFITRLGNYNNREVLGNDKLKLLINLSFSSTFL